MTDITFAPSAVEVIVRNNARLKRLKVALKKERDKRFPNIDRVKELGVELKRRAEMASEVEEVLK